MRFIAHRVFADCRPVSRFERLDLADFHGVELDIRDDGQGRAMVEHSPLFRVRRPGRRPVTKPLDATLDYLAGQARRPEIVLLDIKCEAAARLAAGHVAATPLPFEVLFNCWHGGDVRAVRETLPGARILYTVAPILARRVPRGRFRDLYLSNSFPFLRSSLRFEPRSDKANRHNINVKLISTSRLSAVLPRGIDGVCLHRYFWSEEFADYTAARGLSTAVYGLPSRTHRKLDEIESRADFAIVRAA